jgi:hypothetical protein
MKKAKVLFGALMLAVSAAGVLAAQESIAVTLVVLAPSPAGAEVKTTTCTQTTCTTTIVRN